MYEVGIWFIWLLDAAILALLALGAMIAIFIKRSKYQRESLGCIRAEILLPTGYAEYHTVPSDLNAKTLSIGNFIYFLNPDKRRWGKHPMNPFMGLSWLQVPIRVETWFKDVAEPMRETYDKIIATGAEIKAITREIQATTAAMQIQEIDERQEELTKAISNQPNKNIVYGVLGGGLLLNLLILFLLAQAVGVFGG